MVCNLAGVPIDIFGLVSTILLAFALYFLVLWQKTLTDKRKVENEKLELEKEKKSFEEFFSVHFLKNIYPDELPNVFYQIVRQYVYLQETEIPDSFLSLLCGHPNLLRLMCNTIDLEFERSKESDIRTKLSILLTRLKQLDQQKNGIKLNTHLGDGSTVSITVPYGTELK